MENNVTKLKKAPAYRFTALFVFLLVYILAYAGIQIVASVGPGMMADLGIAEGQLGFLSSVQTLTMALSSILAGSLMTKIGAKKTAVIGLSFLAVAGALFLAHPTSYTMIAIYRLLQGCGTGFTTSCALAMAAVWFPLNERGTASAVMAAFYGVSTTIVTAYSFRATNAGWAWDKTAGLFLLVPGIIIALIIIVFYKDIETKLGVSVIDDALENPVYAEVSTQTATYHKPENWSEAVHFPGFWICGIMLFFYCASCFTTPFIVPLFLTAVGFDAAGSATVMSIGSMGTVVFCIVGGLVADRAMKGRRAEVTMAAFGGAAIVMLIMTFVGDSVGAMGLALIYFVGYGMLNAAGGPAWVIPAEVVGSNFAQQNMGTCLLFSGMGGFTMTWLIGVVAENAGAMAGMLTVTIFQLMVVICAFILRKKYKM